MQKINRVNLSETAEAELARITARVTGAADKNTEVKNQWANLKKGVRTEIAQKLSEMAPGNSRCMYCEDSEGTDLEHFRPKSAYPLHAFLWSNYLLACSRCNSNYKRTQFPLDETGSPLLIDPTVDDPLAHLSLSPTTGSYIGVDEIGAISVEIFGLNRDVCESGRRDMWVTLSVMIPTYTRLIEAQRPVMAGKILETIKRYPFQSVRLQMVRMYRAGGSAHVVLGTEIVEALDRRPELLQN